MLSENDVQELLQQFPQIQFAFAYGSGVVQQEGYNYATSQDKLPMIDMVFAVDNPELWHTQNMVLNPDHYTPFIGMTSHQVATVQQAYGARVWYNTLIPSKLSKSPNRMMKYGVISKEDLLRDLSTWETLYVAGRLHKPVQILRWDPDVIHAMNMNQEFAVRTALLLLQPQFTEKDLFLTIASLSYIGDPRMVVGENPKKITNLVTPILPHYKRLYEPNIVDTRNQFHMREIGSYGYYIQDCSVSARAALCDKLPSQLKKVLLMDGRSRFSFKPPSRSSIRAALAGIVSKSAMSQSFKGIVTAGFQKCSLYIMQKLKKSVLSR